MTRANDVIRFVPMVYLLSPSTGRRVSVQFHPGLMSEDAQDLAKRCISDQIDNTAVEVLHEVRLERLIEYANDWRFMTPEEIRAYINDVPPFFEPPIEANDVGIIEGEA